MQLLSDAKKKKTNFSISFILIIHTSRSTIDLRRKYDYITIGIPFANVVKLTRICIL